ncbi:MAG TPA: hypothetical protein VGC97_09270 [Pyrinomonadaceae bacterium]|jgi:hypothetical protein
MDIYNYIGQMSSYIKARDWQGLESNFEKIAMALAGKDYASAISEVDLTDYRKSLCAKLSLLWREGASFASKSDLFRI